MRKSIIVFLGLLTTLLGAPILRADDFQLWTELKYAHPFKGSGFTLRWATENRIKNDVSNYFLFNTTLGFDYQFKKWLRAGFYYRFQWEEAKPEENRLFPQVEFFWKAGPIFFEDRNRFEFRIFTDDTFRFRYRNRFKFGHEFKAKPVSFTPYISEEIMLETDRTNPSQNRLSAGNVFGFVDGHITFDLFWMMRSDRNQGGASGWTNAQILGTSLGFKY